MRTIVWPPEQWCFVDGVQERAALRERHAEELGRLLSERERIVWEVGYDKAILDVRLAILKVAQDTQDGT